MINKIINEILSLSEENGDIYFQEKNISTLLEFYVQLNNVSKLEFIHRFSDIIDYDKVRCHNSLYAIGQFHDGIKFLLNLRKDIIAILKCIYNNPTTQTTVAYDTSKPTVSDLTNVHSLNEVIKNIFIDLFNLDSCQLCRVTSKSSKQILQRIYHFEAVHPLIDLEDMKRRVGSYRRCYIFTHNLIPEEPIVILYCALASTIFTNIQEIINSNHYQQEENPPEIEACTFFSISSTQKGLSGIGMGAAMIKSALNQLKTEFPYMKHYSTLSPIPNFRRWLTEEFSQPLVLNKFCSPTQIGNLKSIFQVRKQSEIVLRLQTILDLTMVENWEVMNRYYEILSWFLKTVAAKYLCTLKPNGYASNPVCHFHLKNGAVINRINWLADSSLNGIKNSYGVMVNYQYETENIDNYRHQYRENKVIHLSDEIKHLLRNEQIINIEQLKQL